MSILEKDKKLEFEELLSLNYTLDEILDEEIIMKKYYLPTMSMEYTDGKFWYNKFGQQLRNPDQSIIGSTSDYEEEYIPYGDE